MTTTATASETGQQAQGQTASTAGNVHQEYSLVSPVIKAPGLSPEAKAKADQEKQVAEQQEQAKAQGQQEQTTTQPTEKDYRHAQQELGRQIDKKIKMAEKLIQRDPESIYDIAETDPDLANKILERFPDFGAKNVSELMAKNGLKNVDDIKEKVVATSSEVKALQESLREERVLRLKERHPDLKDALEEEFRNLYSDPRFADYEPEKVLQVARAFTGKISQETNANDVALSVLKQQEGATSTLKGSTNQGKVINETPTQRAMRTSFGHSEEDSKKYLPSNIDEFLGG